MNTSPDNMGPFPEPDQITFAWLKQNVPIVWWRRFFVLLVLVFSAGFAVANWEPVAGWVQSQLVIKNTDQRDINAAQLEEYNKIGKPLAHTDDVLLISVLENIRYIRDIINCQIQLPAKNLQMSTQVTEANVTEVLSKLEQQGASELEVQHALETIVDHGRAMAKDQEQSVELIKSLLYEVDELLHTIERVITGRIDQLPIGASSTSALGAYRCSVGIRDG